MLRVILTILVGIFSNMMFTLELPEMKDKPTLHFVLSVTLATLAGVLAWWVLGLRG